MNLKNVKLGKIAHFTVHALKINHKSDMVSQSYFFNRRHTIPTNVIRWEIRVNKMRFLEQKRYQLKQPGAPVYLAQLMKTDFANRLADILISTFKEVIFYDKIDTRHLTRYQAEKMANYRNPLYWTGLNSKQRYRQKARFEELNKLCNQGFIKEMLIPMVEEQTRNLVSGKSENGVQKHRFLLPCKYHKMGTNALLECKVHTSHPPIKKEKKPKKTTTKHKHYCKTCGRDITHQKSNSHYCSEKIYGQQGKHCRNVGTYQNSKLKRNAIIEKETKLLAKLIELPPPQRVTITLNTGQTKHPTLEQIKAYPWSVRRTIVKLTTNRTTLTRRRAKQYVKHLKTEA